MINTDMKPMVSYPSGDAYNADFAKTKEYLKLSQDQRMLRLAANKTEYNKRITEKNKQQQDSTQGPDFIGTMNEAMGKMLDKDFGPNVGMIGRALMPSSNSQAMMDAVMLAMPEVGATGEAISGLARLGLRVGIPAMAGAMGGEIQGGSSGMWQGAASGAAQGLGGEALSLGLGFGRRGVRALSSRPLYSWLESQLPGTVIKDVPSFNRAFMGGEAIKAAQQRLDAINSKLAKKVIPKIAKQMGQVEVDSRAGQALGKEGFAVGQRGGKSVLLGDFRELNRGLDTLENIGWHTKKFGEDETGKAIRSTAHQVEGEIAKQIGDISPKSAIEWYNAKGQLRAAKTLSHMFTEPGVVAADRIHWPKMQQLVHDATAKGYKMDLQQSLGDKQYATLRSVVKNNANIAGETAQAELSGILHRGAQEGTQDIEGVSPVHRAYTHPSLDKPLETKLGLGISMPVFARHVGYVPYDLGKGKGLQALTVLGPYQAALAIGQYIKAQKSVSPDGAPSGAPSGAPGAPTPGSFPPTKVVGSEDTSAGSPPSPPPIIPGYTETGISPSGTPIMTGPTVH